MSLAISLITRLLNVDQKTAERAWLCAGAQDDPLAEPPKEFRQGAGARGYALAVFLRRRPVHFAIGAIGLVSFSGLMLWHVGRWLYGG